MEAAALFQSSSGFSKPSVVVKSSRQPTSRPDFVCFGAKFDFSNGSVKKKNYGGISYSKQGQRRLGFSRRNCVVRASSSSSESPIAPLQLESPVGQFLSQILRSHPHLVPAAVDQQLEQLLTDRDAEEEKPKEEPSVAGTDLVLYRRIAEVKANERKKALEEILYTLVVQRFMDANVSLVPSIAPAASNGSGQVDTWPVQEGKLEQLHSEESMEMIKNHLTLILGDRMDDTRTVAQISKLRVGQVYAASVMYGYFLKRVDQRFQLEKSMKLLPFGSDENESDNVQLRSEELRRPMPNENMHDIEKSETHPDVSSWSGSFKASGFGNGIKPCKLRTYVMSFDADTLQKYATIRSKEAVTIIEKHTEALFGRPEIVITPEGTMDSSKDELIKISFGGLKRLVLEAVTFGSFLWDVESYVDSRYHFVTNL